MPRPSQRLAAADPLIEELFVRLDLDDVAHRIVADTLTTIPGYARMPDGLLMGQILQIAKHYLELFLRCLREDRTPTDDELAVLRSSATERGREGVPLHEMLHAIRLGARVAWQSLIDLAASDDEQRALLQLPDRIMRYVDGVSTVVSQAYLDEREHLVSEKERGARVLLDGLLSGSSGVDELQRLADETGFALAEQYRPFAIAVPGAPTREHARIAIDLRSRGLLALTEGDRVSGLAGADTASVVISRPGAVYTLGEPASPPELAAELDFARRQVQTARGAGLTGMIGPHDLLPELLLAASPRLAGALRAKALGPLEDYAEKRSGELLRTLATFVECGLDRRETIAKLVVHPNTLDYRLRRVEQLTGLRLGDPEHLAMIVLALKQRRLAARPGDLS